MYKIISNTANPHQLFLSGYVRFLLSRLSPLSAVPLCLHSGQSYSRHTESWVFRSSQSPDTNLSGLRISCLCLSSLRLFVLISWLNMLVKFPINIALVVIRPGCYSVRFVVLWGCKLPFIIHLIKRGYLSVYAVA